jgi:hypothetical protein
MKLLFGKIFLSLLFAFLLLKALEYAVGNGLEYNLDFKIGYIKNHLIDADLVIHGPCEAEWMIDPAVIQSSVTGKPYNLAQNHSDFADNYLFFYTYLKHQPPPKSVLLYVTPESFDSAVANTFNTYRYAFLMNDSEVKKVVTEMDPDYAQASTIPFLRYSYYSNFIFYKAMNGYLHLFSGKQTPHHPTGYAAPANSYNQAFQEFRDLNPTEGYFLWAANREHYFLKLVSFMKEKGIRLMVYESPVYHEALTFQKNRKERVARIDSICRANKVPYFQFDSLAMQYDKKNYFSTYNTTIAGNAIFNSFLGKFLKDTLPAILKEAPVAVKSDMTKTE